MPNLLAKEKSPYLLQHAENPVDWMPWGDEAFARAQQANRPLFLSIGYSTCHWCHVMAHESFEDPDIADYLNAHFIPVKVDREERPDVDRIYMAFVQAATGHGGWPLNVWLTPDRKPFFGGTYFPPEDRQGRAGFPSVLRAIARGWENDRDRLVAEGERAVKLLRAAELDRSSHESAAEESNLAESAIDAYERGFRYFFEAFDAENGGFGGAPKFPRAATLNFLHRVAALQGTASGAGAEAARMSGSTLRQMGMGGIHDHVGGGFHRYSVDAHWFVPHFEKMLYDQAQIALNCLEARLVTGDERYAWLARDIFGYVARDLTAPEGGFCSAEDADSEPPGGGHPAEGAFYLWSFGEIGAVLGDGAPLFNAHFGILEGGNIPPGSDPFGEFRGLNLPAQRQPLVETARAFELDPEEANRRLVGALDALRKVRARRPRPQRDGKIITAWNGLMISALARGHAILGDATLLEAATRAAAFLERELYDADSGRLHRSWLDGRGRSAAFAEDYAFLIQGLLDLYEAGFEGRWLIWADRLQKTLDENFFDSNRGGYFDASADASDLIVRLQEDYDGAEPAASSVAVLNLVRLAGMLHDDRRREQATQTVEAFRGRWMAMPQVMPQMLCAIEAVLEPPASVVLAGDPDTADYRALIAVLYERPGRRRAILRADPAIPWTSGMTPIGGHAAAYVCENFACQAPVGTADDLRKLLQSGG